MRFTDDVAPVAGVCIAQARPIVSCMQNEQAETLHCTRPINTTFLLGPKWTPSPYALQVSACSEAKRLGQSRVPLHLVAGWLDATASPAICAFLNGQHAAGVCVHMFASRVQGLSPHQLTTGPHGDQRYVSRFDGSDPRKGSEAVEEEVWITSYHASGNMSNLSKMVAVVTRSPALSGSELIIGPWGHGGLTNYSPQKQSKDGGRSTFPQALHTIAFFDRVCGYHPAGRCCFVAPLRCCAQCSRQVLAEA